MTTVKSPASLLLRVLFLAGLLCVVSRFARAETSAPDLHTYESPYYYIHTDLDEDSAREAYIRMTRMFEEYRARTAGFSGSVRDKFPFFLFKNRDDYLAAGGIPHSDGVFIYAGSFGKLMACAGEHTDDRTWHIVQHEGFHQFAHAVIRGELPMWLNEGLAEYFGEAIFTGDKFISGVIPPYRLARIKEEISLKQFKPIRDMMNLDRDAWNANLDIRNYDQGWSMVHFLAQGQDGKYQKAFVAYINALGHGVSATVAWNNIFGNDTDAFEQKWQTWWQNLPDNPTQLQYQKATVLALTSFIARADVLNQHFDNAEDFFKQASDKTLKIGEKDWLPPALLARFLEQADATGTWTVHYDTPKHPNHPSLICITPDGTKLTGTYTLLGSKVAATQIEVVPPKAAKKAPGT